MNYTRSMQALLVLPILNVLITVLFIAMFKYLQWGSDYDSLWSAIGLVCIGMLLMGVIATEAYIIYTTYCYYLLPEFEENCENEYMENMRKEDSPSNTVKFMV